MSKHLLFPLFIFFTLSACNIINPKEQVPTYIHLEPFDFSNPDSSFTGSSSHSIPSARLSIDDKIIGTFDLPCTVPVIMSKTSLLAIAPFVSNQGLKSYVFNYFLYERDSTTFLYNPGKIQNYTPKTRYSRDLTSNAFKLKINFEEGLFFKNLLGDTTIVLEKDPSKVFEGSAVGAIYLKSPLKFSENISTNYFGYTENSCFLEFDYKCSIPVQIGLQAEDADGKIYGEYLAGYYPKDTWSKIYMDLSTFMKANKSYTKFYIKVRSTLEEFDGKYTDGYVLLDNIKVISR